jgi:hypothetical protein
MFLLVILSLEYLNANMKLFYHDACDLYVFNEKQIWKKMNLKKERGLEGKYDFVKSVALWKLKGCEKVLKRKEKFILDFLL